MGPNNISRRAEDTYLKFCTKINLEGCLTKNEKNGQKRAWFTSRDLLFQIFGRRDPLISLERLSLQFCTKDTKPKNKKLVKRGRGLGHVTNLSNFGTPNISGTAEDTNIKFCKQIDLEEY